MSWNRKFFQNCILVTAITVFLGGCATEKDPSQLSYAAADEKAGLQTSSPTLKPYFVRLYQEGRDNAVLNRMRLVSAAIDEGDWNTAENQLDQIIPEIEALGPADAKSREALSNFKSEDVKKFKGEPYERAMVYFYRGLAYMRKNDWSNARACFKSVQLQDWSSKNPQSADWASADWLEGWCDHQLGEESNARECWARAGQHSHGRLTAPSSEDNAICIGLLGYGPIKLSKGTYGEQLAYRENSSNATGAILKVGQNEITMPVAENIYAQASNRGVRRMDQINEDKASVKEDSNTAGDVLVGAGAVTAVGGSMSRSKNAEIAGLGALAAGLITKGISSAIKPKSDVRSWDLLPGTIVLKSFRLAPSEKSFEYKVTDRNGRIVRPYTISNSQVNESKIIVFTER